MTSGFTLSRRLFLQRISACGLLTLSPALRAAVTLASSEARPLLELPRRRLGRTGLHVSTLGLNFANPIPAEVVDYAVDIGINYLDTARRYRQGQGETELAPILERRRAEVVVASKWHRREGAGSAGQVLTSLERSLRALGTDHLDVWLTDSLSRPEQAHIEPWLEAATQARQQGKTRFIGLTAWEGDLPGIVRAAVEAEVYDVVHLRYVPVDFDLAQPAIHAADLGLVAMYVLSAARDGAIADVTTATGRRDAVAWALSDARPACALVETPRLDDVRLFAEGALRAEPRTAS